MTARPAKASILLVDDRPENLVALREVLEPLGQDLVSARSGEEALRFLLRREFALILLDVQMPALNGFETVELIRQRERTRSVPIIFLTAVGVDDEYVSRGYRAGAVDYVVKPFDPAVLRSKVAVFVELYEKTRQHEEQAELLRRQELAELRRQSDERFRNLAEAMPQIVWTSGADGSIAYVNGGWLEYTGMTLEEARRFGWRPALHWDDRAATLERWQRSLASGDTFETECRFRRAGDGSYRWQLVRALPTRDEAGGIAGWVGTCTDIDDQKRIEEALRFLVEAGAALGSTLDDARALARVAELAVGRIADWCAIDMVEEDGSLRRLAIAHADPEKRKFALELQRRYPPDPSGPAGVAKVVRTGAAELVPELREAALEAAAADELHLRLLRELGLASSICVPIVARGRVLGAISLVWAEPGRRYTADDLALAEELARRAATAVDNARLYEEAESRARAARVLATVGDGVFLLDREEVVRLWNPAAEAITGLAAETVVGRRAEQVIPRWTELARRVPVAEAPGPAAAESVPFEVGGRELWLSISGVGFDEGTVYAFRDLTEELAVEQMKSEFVATVSHELRTPLAAIYGAATTILRRNHELAEEIRDRLLAVIADEADRLVEIVNEVLLASHLDSGELHLTIESCDAVELARGVLEAARLHSPEQISIELKAAPDLPPVAADALQLRQVLTNLIDNAIKYSPGGGPVELELDASETRLRFSVRDEGLGIPSSERRRIFEKFYRLDPNMANGVGGTGLGLYICRELVRRLEGRIWVEPNDVHGSVFHVELPLAQQPARPMRAQAGSSA